MSPRLWLQGSSGGGAGSTTLDQFDFLYITRAFSHVNFNTFFVGGGGHVGGYRQSSGAQNDEIVIRLPAALSAGTWAMALAHNTSSNRGIYTISASADASAWSDIATVDGYSSSATNGVRTEFSVTMPAGTKYLRLRMATKNASSSSFFGTFAEVSGVRTA